MNRIEMYQHFMDRVKEMHIAFGLSVSKEQLDDDEIALATNLIIEETTETNHAIKTHNIEETIDGMCDMIVVYCGYQVRVDCNSINLIRDSLDIVVDQYWENNAGNRDLIHHFDLVMDANMDKLCSSEEDAQKSVDEYTKNGVETYYKESPHLGKWVVYRKDGKFLKRFGWRAPVHVPHISNIDEYARWTEMMWHSGNHEDPAKEIDERDHTICGYGLAGETGEVLELLKKRVRDGVLDREELKLELGDVGYYWNRLCRLHGFWPSEVLLANHKKLIARRAKKAIERSKG